jgi:phosphatidylserine/phosphatidylglycerophosphate/cardiolipin synthase-like enzyme
MSPDECRSALQHTLHDRRLSRAERQALSAVVEQSNPTPADIDNYRSIAFDLAREATAGGFDVGRTLDWLEDVTRILRPVAHASGAAGQRACFSPGEACRGQIRELLLQARSTIDICVFTITDDRISDAILKAHRRGVSLRIITDDDKSGDLGSDIMRHSEDGIPIRIDKTPHHMHHKFALFDRRTLITGSYNWTRSAARDNEENLVVLSDRNLAAEFQRVFDGLWDRFS